MLGRDLGGSVALDSAAAGVLSASIDADGRTHSGAAARDSADADEPKLCPDSGPEDFTGRSERAIAYQTQITGLPPGLAVRLNDVEFDGCRESDGTMLEAKGPGYAKFMISRTDWKTWFTGAESVKEQMENQHKAAGDRLVEWHAAEKPFADYLRDLAVENKWNNIVVIYTPAEVP